ncbi:hypothetical protein AX17_000164 [Amanita inopinata Kibby_2008]|nr:hypothetical protein AX17_000164 [Amanita inopinata Kibby_2008]
MPCIDDSGCVLIIGATSGIGRALALSIAALPSKPTVIAAGRRRDRLEELAKARLETAEIDIDADRAALKRFADDIVKDYPDLDTVIFCAGVQHEIDFKDGVDVDKLASEININYTSVVTLTSFFLPHLLRLSEQGRPAFIIPVTAGLGIVPGPWVFNYSATKAALHSFTVSLRAQLQETNIHIIEIIPPLVESELHDAYHTADKLAKFWMPLEEYITVTMEGLRKGQEVVSAGASSEYYNRFEVGKDEMARQALMKRNQW